MSLLSINQCLDFAAVIYDEIDQLGVWICQGYDVVQIACSERHVTGLDISQNAINKALKVRHLFYFQLLITATQLHSESFLIRSTLKMSWQLFSSLPKAMQFTFLKVDFFTWHPTELFDLIFDYT